MSKTKTIWIMNATSDSCDDYPCCAQWDHSPTDEEVNRVRVKLDGQFLEDGTEFDDDPRYVELDGRWWETYINDWTITEVKT